MADIRFAMMSIKDARSSVRVTSIQVQIADSFYERLLGLLPRRSIADSEGLMLVPCSSIHTVGMRFPIDVLFLDFQNKVLGYSDSVLPNRIRVAPRGTVKVLEIAEGNRIRTGINLDDYLIFD